MIAESVSPDLAALIEGGGAGGVTLVGLALWRIGTMCKSGLAEVKSALAEWRHEAKVRLAHYTTEETLLRELKDERSQWQAQSEAEATMRRELMKFRADFDSLERRLRRDERRDEGHG